ncbi:general transcription factor 3C polypeptide 1-like [Lampris incognitus]|uniref:general transcription factor 3C polypeptide 1-like n=1 Tax=Lampris incognitus TaxID=2546036 RepID=UPI0024B621F8|nr:general transcription factor 3C polypeptide 1-like [Lampris incognitus]
MDALSIVEDEVALEGLDGITIPSLWIRLENRDPKFPLILDACTKEFIWRSLLFNSDLKFYELPRPRGDVVLRDRFAEIDPETEIQTTERFSDGTKDVYPVCVIVEDKNGVQGSCVFYKERRDVSKIVRTNAFTALLSLDEAFRRFGRKLVVVASQIVRFRALIGVENDPDLKLNDHSYCILERLGRARWQGELQRDLHICSFKTDAGKLHYMRRFLDRHGLITMQSFVKRMPTGQQQYSILLLLKRFHVNRRSRYDILMESMSNILQEAPGQLAPTMTVREQLRVSESIFKRVYQYMQSAKLVQVVSRPVEDLNLGAEPCTTSKGTKASVRCLKLLKPYVKKEEIVEDDNDDDIVPFEGRVMERDLLVQAYHNVISSGTRGISQTTLSLRMNIGKLEARMICRQLERDGMIKGLMEDVGRQRITRFISHRCVGVSDSVQQFAKEWERNKLLYSSEIPKTAPRTSKSSATNLKTPSKATDKKTVPKIHKKGRGKKEDVMAASQKHSSSQQDEDYEGANGGCVKRKRKSKELKKKAKMKGKQTPEMEDEESILNYAIPSDHNEAVKTVSDEAEYNIKVLEEVSVAPNFTTKKTSSQRRHMARPHETYRLLRRKNLIIETVRSLRIIEGLYTLQKMISDEEKQDGVSTKCCKKSILRLIRSLSREGMLKMFTTTVIQDGISKKVEMVVHPSVQPNDDIVKRTIEQVRFRISSSYSVLRQQQAEERAKDQENESKGKTASINKGQKNKTDKKKTDPKEYDDFKPTPVKGLSRTLGFQPKMHRLRVIHTFLWFLIYGHPLQQGSTYTQPGATNTDEPENSRPHNGKDRHSSQNVDGQMQTFENLEPDTGEQKMSESSLPSPEINSLGEEDVELMDISNSPEAHSDIEVFLDEDSWRRFIPPLRFHTEFGHGWALVSDLLLSLPLSLFVQFVQVNFEVDGLEEYLNDPVKQHYLVRTLPSRIRRQLLYKRKYIYTFHENMQRLVYMGLVQFGPVEKFKDKEQVFVYLRRNATIVDTTSTEPHYWLVTESPDKPFERRQYTFNTAEDVENYWFDLLCVCLNTPLGVIRIKRKVQDEEQPAPPHHPERYKFLRLAYLLKGSREVCDDGSIPGDGKGAGGLDSEFFSHLKRNWLWTCHLLSSKKSPIGGEVNCSTIRLKSLLSRNALRLALKAVGSTNPRCVTTKCPLITEENVEMAIEPASRNQHVAGGKRQKRKRNKKEIVKIPRKKKKEPRIRGPAHDEADHQALKRMTRQRVIWSIQEDSLMMLCSVASRLLNSKLKRPFVAHCVVRDLLQAEFENSLDKTSVAVGRRSRYILKNPQTLLNYRICLAEVYQDKPLMELLEKMKPTNPESPEDCAKAFSEYTRLLRQKFSSTMTSWDITIPDTKHELFSRFKVYTIGDGKEMPFKDTLTCTEDIHAIVLNNLIQSTLVMSNSQMKSSRSFQTFHMYSKYSQEVLFEVFIDCRRRGLVNRRRVNKATGPKKNRALPILPMSYQLSQTYYRCFAWRFPFTLCTDVFRFRRTLADKGARDDLPLTAFYHETESRMDERKGLTERMSEKPSQRETEEDKERAGDRQRNGGQWEGKQDGRPQEQPGRQTDKENLDTMKEGGVDQSKGDEEKMVKECSGRTKAKDVHMNPVDSLITTSSEELSTVREPAGTVTANPSPPLSEENQDVSEMLRFPLDSLGGACATSLSLMTLGLLSVHVSIPKQVVVVDSSMVDNEVVKSMASLEEEDDDDDEAEECEGRKRLEVKSHQASHTNYLLMQGYCCPGIVKLRNLNTSDNIVVESCILRLQLRNTPAHQLFSEGESPLLDISKCGPSLLPSILSHSIHPLSPPTSPSSLVQCDLRLTHQRGYSPQDMEAWAELRKSLDEARENGVAACDLHRAHTHLVEPCSGRTRSLQQYMQELQEEGQVLQVGGMGLRWVRMQYAEPWLLTSYTKPQSQPQLIRERQLPLWKKHHNIPFMRKRCRDVPGEEEEPPRKKAVEDRERGKEREGGNESSSSMLTDEGNSGVAVDEPREGADEERQDGPLNLVEEKGVQTVSEMEGDKQSVKKEDKSEEKPLPQEEVKEERLDQEEIIQDRDDDNDGVCSPLSPAAPTHSNTDEIYSFISRPWRMVDGSVNRPACKGMLEAILYHIMSKPGLTEQTLVEHYKDVLQPVVILDLTQALIELGCVKKRSVIKGPKPSLFSRSAGRIGGDTGVGTEDANSVFYEPTISCCLRLAQVLPNEPHWNEFIQ